MYVQYSTYQHVNARAMYVVCTACEFEAMEGSHREKREQRSDETSLLFRSDFCDFDGSGFPTGSERFVNAETVCGRSVVGIN